jgi:hypothetical protein
LLAATAVVFAFIVLVERPLRQERLRQASRAVLPGFDPGTITNIEIQSWGQPVIAARRSGSGSSQWRLIQPISYPAQDDRVEALLAVLAKLEWQDRITEAELQDRPDAQEQFGFTRPQFSLVLKGTGPTRRLDIGALSPLGDQVFLSVVGDIRICLAGTDVLRVIPRDKNQWRDLTLLDLTNLPFGALRVRSAGKEFEFERDPTNHFWLMKLPLPARADSARINELLGQLQQCRVSAFVNDDLQADLEPYGLQTSPQTPELDLSFLQGTNVVAALQVGASPSNHLELAYARRGDSGNIVAVAREPLRGWQGAYTNFLDQHLLSVPPSWIESIEVRGDDNFTAQKQSNGQWQVLAGTRFTADALLMEDWLAGFTNIATEIEKTVVADFSDYGLSRPALRETVKFGPAAGGLAPAQIDFGAVHNGRVFERRADESSVNTISREEFDRLPRVSWQLRDRSIWTFQSSNVISVTVQQMGGTRKFLRDPQGEWTFAPGYHGPPYINSPSLEEGVHRIGELRAIYWDGVGEDHLERFGFAQTDYRLEFAVQRPDRTETLRLEFGARSPYSHPYASVVRDGERLIFEFPVDLYENFVVPDLSVPGAVRHH